MDLKDLSAEEIARILQFLGYGRVSAPVWFIGFEEGLGSMNSEDTQKNLKARGQFQSVMDLHKAHMLLQQKGQAIDIEKAPPSTQVWKNMAKIMLARDGVKDWRSREAIKHYISFCLGREHPKVGYTFLTELSPIPARSTAQAKKWRALFADRDSILAETIEGRRHKLDELLRVNTPDLVICYGVTRANDFAEALKVKWHRIWPQDPDPICSKVCASEDFKRLLLPFFGMAQMKDLVIEKLLAQGLLT